MSKVPVPDKETMQNMKIRSKWIYTPESLSLHEYFQLVLASSRKSMQESEVGNKLHGVMEIDVIKYVKFQVILYYFLYKNYFKKVIFYINWSYLITRDEQ